MRELLNVFYTHSERISDEEKDILLLPSEYLGIVALETWEVNGMIKRKAVCVTAGITSYILGHGEFKEIPTYKQKDTLLGLNEVGSKNGK